MKRHAKTRGYARRLPLPWGGASFSSSVFIVLSLVLMIVSAIKPRVFDGVRNSATEGFAPILIVAGLPFQNFALFLHDVTGFAQLQADKKRLQEENEKLREWYQMALLLDSENKSLRKLLNMAPMPEYTHVGARVMSDSGSTYAKSLLVAVGANQGAKKGNAVLSGDGLIGRIIDLSDSTARVLLVTDFNSRVPVVVENTSQHAIMAGNNTVRPRLIHLPQESDISVGVRVVTSGYGGIYPHGIPVGRVALSEKDGSYEIVLFADLDALQNVKIMQEKTTGGRR